MAYAEYQKKELGLDLNSFNRPVEYSGIKSWVRLITQLLFTIPGTYPTAPDLGIGIQTYRFSFFDETKDKLEEVINEQVRTYLPDIPFSAVNIEYQEILGIPVLSLALEFRVTNDNLEVVHVAIDTSSKTLNYEIAF